MQKLFPIVVIAFILCLMSVVGNISISTDGPHARTSEPTDFDLVRQHGQLINNLGCYRVFINETLGDYLTAEETGSCPGHYPYPVADLEHVARLIRLYVEIE